MCRWTVTWSSIGRLVVLLPAMCNAGLPDRRFFPQGNVNNRNKYRCACPTVNVATVGKKSLPSRGD